jgi:hypothetical protein
MVRIRRYYYTKNLDGILTIFFKNIQILQKRQKISGYLNRLSQDARTVENSSTEKKVMDGKMAIHFY